PEIYAYHRPWITKTPQLYQDATRDLIQRANDGKSAEYAQARRQVDIVRRDIKNVFADVDLLVTPTHRGTAPLIAPPPQAGGSGANALAGIRGVLNTAAFNIYGLPTISIPCGFTTSGLPIGLQISGAHFAETTVIALAYAYEKVTEWHKRR